jgi:hypothetical protein
VLSFSGSALHFKEVYRDLCIQESYFESFLCEFRIFMCAQEVFLFCSRDISCAQEEKMVAFSRCVVDQGVCDVFSRKFVADGVRRSCRVQCSLVVSTLDC